MNADIQIEHIQHVFEDRLSKIPSEIHRFQIHDTEYWFYAGKSEAYDEVLREIKSLAARSE